MNSIQQNLDSLYRTTYFSTPAANNDVRTLTQDINDNIDKIVSKNLNTIGSPSISVLYSRIYNEKTNGKNPIANDLSKMLEDPMMMDELYATFMSNRFVKELDGEIDSVCKYLPDLEEALNAKKDSVLSSDHFSKDFLSVRFPGNLDNAQFANRITELKKKYKLLKVIEEIYEETAKYGEVYMYCVPYSIALTKLLATKPHTDPFAKYNRSKNESVLTEADISDAIQSGLETYTFSMTSSKATIIGGDSTITLSNPIRLVESTTYSHGEKKTISKPVNILKDNESFKLDIEINTSGIVESAVQESFHRNRVNRHVPSSMRESFVESCSIKEAKQQPEAKGNLNNNFFTDKDNPEIVNDGLIGSGNQDIDYSRFKVKVPGAVVKKLKHEYVIPVYIEESCMGYYYIEIRTKDVGDEMMGFRNLMGDPLTGMSGEAKANFNNIDSMRQEETIRYVAGQLSQFIDKKFVNNNQDLSKEIYQILKYNDLFNSPSMDIFKVTFVPPEDIHHFYFRKDPDSHRGISDLAKGLIPAKLYASLYITGAIGIMTRGQDKRVYYVKQTVDSNISQQLMNVINQIKQGNFGIRQFNSINNVLNITGRFNDFVIPTSSSGDSPINIDVIQGQQFEINNEFMEGLKEMAIESIEVPMEIVQSRKSVDFASQLSMSSSKFLRTVYKRQERCQEMFSPFISAIYSYEYGDMVDLDVTLPPPVFLDMANTNQLINNTKEFVDSIIDIEMQDEQDDELKSIYRHNLFMHYIGTHIDISEHEHILERSKVEQNSKAKESDRATQEPEEDTGDNW